MKSCTVVLVVLLACPVQMMFGSGFPFVPIVNPAVNRALNPAFNPAINPAINPAFNPAFNPANNVNGAINGFSALGRGSFLSEALGNDNLVELAILREILNPTSATTTTRSGSNGIVRQLVRAAFFNELDSIDPIFDSAIRRGRRRQSQAARSNSRQISGVTNAALNRRSTTY